MVQIGDIAQLEEKEFLKFKDLIYKNTGIFLRETKREMVNSRLLKRLRAYNFSSFSQYYNYLTTQDDGSELMEMINCVTTNKTDFFRENNHFEFLTNNLLPELKQNCYKNGNLNLRVWSAACSTGEEPYTIGMVVKEYFKNNTGWDIKILASDIDTNVLKKAQEGVYTYEQVKDIPMEFLKEYFYKGEGQNEGFFKIKEKVKDLVAFRKINLIEGNYPINGQLDIIFCRNVFIYFDQNTINTIINRFYNHLKPGGYLFLGHSESLDVNVEYKNKFRLMAHTVYSKI